MLFGGELQIDAKNKQTKKTKQNKKKNNNNDTNKKNSNILKAHIRYL